MSSQKCPRCGSDRTHFADSYSDGEERCERSFGNQQCVSKSCGLPCRLWPEWQAMKDQIDRIKAAAVDQKCPRCGSHPTTGFQVNSCVMRDCGLPVQLWPTWAAMREQLEGRIREVGLLNVAMRDLQDETARLTAILDKLPKMADGKGKQIVNFDITLERDSVVAIR